NQSAVQIIEAQPGSQIALVRALPASNPQMQRRSPYPAARVGRHGLIAVVRVKVLALELARVKGIIPVVLAGPEDLFIQGLFPWALCRCQADPGSVQPVRGALLTGPDRLR